MTTSHAALAPLAAELARHPAAAAISPGQVVAIATELAALVREYGPIAVQLVQQVEQLIQQFRTQQPAPAA